MTTKARQILDEIGDNHSGAVEKHIRSIEHLEKKVASLETIESQLEQAAEDAMFQLVTSLPATGKADIYYVMLNTTTQKYEEYTWNGTSYDKVGAIGDAVYPTLVTKPGYKGVSKTSSGYSSANPSELEYYERTDGTYTFTATEDTTTRTVSGYSAVSSSSEGYSSANPKTNGWYESDGNDGYQLTNDEDTTTSPEKTYYTQATEDNGKTYWTLTPGYAFVDSSTSGYSSMNPKKLDWYEFDNGTFEATVDQVPASGKDYYVSVS